MIDNDEAYDDQYEVLKCRPGIVVEIGMPYLYVSVKLRISDVGGRVGHSFRCKLLYSCTSTLIEQTVMFHNYYYIHYFNLKKMSYCLLCHPYI